MYSLNDIDTLLEIKDYLADGLNMAGIKRVYEMKKEEEEAVKHKQTLTDNDVRRIFYDEILLQGGLNQANTYHQRGPKLN